MRIGSQQQADALSLAPVGHPPQAFPQPLGVAAIHHHRQVGLIQ
ncbi:MAG: hypothetical protein ACK56F_18485 [bacterium]